MVPADLLILILTLLHMKGPTGLGDHLTFTVLHLVKVVLGTMGKSIGEPMENHIPDGKKYASSIYLLNRDGACPPDDHLVAIENKFNLMVLFSIFRPSSYETKVEKIENDGYLKKSRTSNPFQKSNGFGDLIPLNKNCYRDQLYLNDWFCPWTFC